MCPWAPSPPVPRPPLRMQGRQLASGRHAQPHPRLRDLAARSVEAAWVYRPWRSAFKQRACRPLYAVLTAHPPQWRRKLLPGKNIAVCGGLGEAVRRQEGHDVARYRVPLRVVEHLVVHLSVPAHLDRRPEAVGERARRSEEHTSELQSQSNLVCRLLLEKKKTSN